MEPRGRARKGEEGEDSVSDRRKSVEEGSAWIPILSGPGGWVRRRGLSLERCSGPSYLLGQCPCGPVPPAVTGWWRGEGGTVTRPGAGMRDR